MSQSGSGNNERNKRDRESDESGPEFQELFPDITIRSPLAKKDRQEKRMESWEDSNADKELIAVAIVINNLVTNAEQDRVKKLIDCYNPLIREEIDMMKDHIISCCKNWDDKNEVLKDAIRHVWPEIDIDLENIDHKDEKDHVSKLVDILLIAIETLMPKQCKECDLYYYAFNETKPAIRCMWCKGGAHDCIDRGNKEKLKGMVWYCKVCNDLLHKQILPKIDLIKKMELTKKETEINFEGFVSKSKENVDNNGRKVNALQDKEKDKDLVLLEEPEQERGDEPTVNPSQQVTEGVTRSNESNQSQQGNLAGRKESDEQEVCWFWKNRKCRFMESCNKEHPEQCKAMMEYGLCKNSKCNLIHPKICRDLFFKGNCYRGESCRFIHPSKCSNRLDNESNMVNKGGYYQKPYNQQEPNNQNRGNPILSNPFLEQWPQMSQGINNSNNIWKERESQSMMQMMQNMMQKMMIMDQKIMSIGTVGPNYSRML